MSINTYIHERFSDTLDDILTRCEVDAVMRDLLESIELWDLSIAINTMKKELNLQIRCSADYKQESILLKEKNHELESKILNANKNAQRTINLFLHNSFYILKQNKEISKLKKTIIKSDNISKESPSLTPSTGNAVTDVITKTEKIETIQEIPVMIKSHVPTIVIKYNLMTSLEDRMLLKVFAFLQAKDVIFAAQVNRNFFARVDILFGIESQIVKQEWTETRTGEGMSSSIDNSISTSSLTTTSTSTTITFLGETIIPSLQEHTVGSINPNISRNNYNNNVPTPQGISPIILEQITRKLTGQEMKEIQNLLHNHRIQCNRLQQYELDHEDISAKLESSEKIRIFLLNKLRAAEMALKTSLEAESTLRNKTIADSEVISYLDLHAQELESKLNLAMQKKIALETSLNLHILQNEQLIEKLKSHTQSENMSANLQEIETTFKNQKRILIREIKSLRNELEVTKREKDICNSQLDALRVVLLTNSNSNSNSNNRAVSNVAMNNNINR